MVATATPRGRLLRSRGRTPLALLAAGTLVAGDTLLVGHVGDSRAYLLHDGELRQVTDDHSLVEELVREGRLTADEAAVHPQRSIITRALGVDASVEVDVYPVELVPGDRLLLCSDGLTRMVAPDDIAATLRTMFESPEFAASLGRKFRDPVHYVIAAVRLACSWQVNAGRDAEIGATFYGTGGGASLRNVGGSFYDFAAERYRGTATETLAGGPDDWGGRAAVDWARRLAGGARYEPEIEQIVEVTRVLDAIYERAGKP